MIKYLLTKDSGGKFRYAVVECFEEWNPVAKGFVIQKSYGTVRGKNILSPAIIIDRPKQKRTWKEQYTLQFNSEVKKFLDKGYVEVEKHPNDIPDEELNNIYGDVKTNQYGVIKPMLAKQYDKVTNKKIFDNINSFAIYHCFVFGFCCFIKFYFCFIEYKFFASRYGKFF